MAETHNFHAHKLFSVKDWVCVVAGGGQSHHCNAIIPKLTESASGIGLMAAQALSANGISIPDHD